MKKILVISLIGLLASCACGGGEKKSNAVAEPMTLTIPSPPMSIQSDDNHAVFMAKNFWENLSFSDTTQIEVIDEQNIANYVATLRVVTLTREQVESSINSVLDRAQAQPAMYMRFVDLFDKYLHEPNSPLRHEENYIVVLNHYLGTDVLSSVEKEKYVRRLAMAMKNRPGDKAANFTYTLADGRQGRLHDIKADFTLLFISNPGCSMCGEITEAIKANTKVSDMIDRGTIKVLVVYPDEDLGEWNAHRGDIPTNWLNAYDKSLAIRKGELYDIKAIPTLYLLDRNKTVLVKDFVDVMEVEYYFAWNPISQ